MDNPKIAVQLHVNAFEADGLKTSYSLEIDFTMTGSSGRGCFIGQLDSQS
jgi:hypothetical protein